jgi:hypothetical protein
MIWEAGTWYHFAAADILKTNLFAMDLIRGILNTMLLHLPCRQKNNPAHKNNPDQINKNAVHSKCAAFLFLKVRSTFLLQFGSTCREFPALSQFVITSGNRGFNEFKRWGSTGFSIRAG